MASEDNKVVLQYPGGEYEMDIKQSTEGDSGFDISKLRNETGLVTFDPGYTSTGSTESKITFINGEEGIYATAATISRTLRKTLPLTRFPIC